MKEFETINFETETTLLESFDRNVLFRFAVIGLKNFPVLKQQLF